MGWEQNKYYYALNANNNTANDSPKIPVCVVVCTQPEYKIFGQTASEEVSLGGWQVAFHNFTDWKVVSSRVQLVRYYAASTAKVTLAIDLPDLNGTIPAPGLSFTAGSSKLNASNYNPDKVVNFNQRGGYEEQTYEIRPEMNIEIYMGYLDKFESVQSFITSVGGKYKVNPKKFTKVFNGVIDTVDLKLGRGENPMDGVTCTIVARDQMRYIIDNKFFGSLQVGGEDFGSPYGVSRNKIIRSLIEQGSAGACKVADDPLFHPSGRPPMKIAGLYEKEVTGATRDRTEVLAGAGVPFSIADQFPVDAIRWFSLIETLPRELYCDVETGDIAWTIRMLGEPFKTSPEANLFSNLEEFAEEELSDSTNLDEVIYKHLSRLSPNQTNNVSFTYADAKTLAYQITSAYNAVLQKFPEFSKFYPLHHFLGQLSLESGLNPYVNVKGKIAYTNDNQPVLSGNNSSPFARGTYAGASGISQILLYTHTDRALKISSGNHLVYADYSEMIPDVTDTEGKQQSSIPKPVYYYLRVQLSLIADLIYDPWGNGLPSISDLYGRGLITSDTAQKLVLRAYHGRNNYVLRTLVSRNRRFTYEDYRELADVNGATAKTENKQYLSSLLKRSNKFYSASSASSKEPVQKATEQLPSLSAEGIQILRGEDDPWVYSYKKTVNVRNKTIKPNMISGHASWSTLGMITKFTLLNPGSAKGTGNVGIKVSHSLRGNPLTYINGKTDTLKQIFKSSNGLPDATKNPIGSTDPAYIQNVSAATRDFSNNSEASIEDLLNQVAENDITAPLKFLSKIRYPIRNRYIWDESSDSKMSDVVADLILNAMMNIYAQDINAVDFLVPLNPDLRPGHVAELYNMGYFNGEQFRVEGVIHMFASGGVQSGCTTMAVGVSKQGSQNPIEAVNLLNEIIKLQKMSAYDFKGSSENSRPETPAAKTDNTVKAVKNYVSNSSEVKKILDFSSLSSFMKDDFGTIVSLFEQFGVNRSQTTLASKFLKKYGQNLDNPLINFADWLTPDFSEESLNLRNAFRKLVYNYCFNHLSSFLGNTENFEPYYSNSAWSKNQGIDYGQCIKELNSFLVELVDSLKQAIVIKNDTTYSQKVAPFIALFSPDNSGYATNFFQKLHASPEFTAFVTANKPVINFRYSSGLSPYAPLLIQAGFWTTFLSPASGDGMLTVQAAIKGIKSLNYSKLYPQRSSEFKYDFTSGEKNIDTSNLKYSVESPAEYKNSSFHTGTEFKKSMVISYLTHLYLDGLVYLENLKNGKVPTVKIDNFASEEAKINSILSKLKSMVEQENGGIVIANRTRTGQKPIKR